MAFVTVRTTKKRYDPRKIKEGIVRVGFFSGMRYAEGLSVAQVARWQEYGTGGKYAIPARPFMRPALHQGQNQLKETLRDLYRQALKDNTDTTKALAKFGFVAVEKVKSQIDATYAPANSPATLHGSWIHWPSGKSYLIKPKSGSHPLIDTGFMRDSVDFQVEERFK